MAAPAPAAGLLIGYHTDDALYRREAARLGASVARLGLPLRLTTVPAGDWLAIVRDKVDFLIAERRRHRGPLLYVDVDAVVHHDPWERLADIAADASYAVLNDGKARSSTVFLADTPGAHAFLGDWHARLAAAPQAWDQHPLDDIARDAREGLQLPYRYAPLPTGLCYIFDRGEMLCGAGVTPVIEQLQASRDLTAVGKPRHAARHARIAEIERMLGMASEPPLG